MCQICEPNGQSSKTPMILGELQSSLSCTLRINRGTHRIFDAFSTLDCQTGSPGTAGSFFGKPSLFTCPRPPGGRPSTHTMYFRASSSGTRLLGRGILPRRDRRIPGSGSPIVRGDRGPGQAHREVLLEEAI